MARQKGIFKVDGTLDDVTFYKSKDGFMVREKGGVSADRIASDPAFERTRENQKEFGRAGKAGKLLRSAIRVLLQTASDHRMVSRMLKEMMRVVKADQTNDRGKRNVLDGELELLEGFEFNDSGKLGQTLFAPYTASINRVTGVLEVVIPSFIPSDRIVAPQGSTHFKIASMGAEIDFTAESYVTEGSESSILPLDSTPTGVVTLTNPVTANSTQPLFLLLSIQFYQEVNGSKYPLKNGGFNALAMIKVSGV